MTQDVIDADYALNILNDAKDEVEASHPWLQLTKEQSYSVSSGYTYASALGTLPTRFAVDIRMTEGDGNFDYHKIRFDDRQAKVHDSTGYFIDLNGGNIHLGGSHDAKTMYLYYTEYSADLTSSDTWGFPSRFHSILPLKMAELYYLSDAGEKSRSWNQEWAVQFERKMAQMVQWDEQLKLRNLSRSSKPGWTAKSNEIR